MFKLGIIGYSGKVLSVGIFGGGYTGANSNYTDKYTYATDTVAAGTVLGSARYYLAAASSNPGWA